VSGCYRLAGGGELTRKTTCQEGRERKSGSRFLGLSGSRFFCFCLTAEGVCLFVCFAAQYVFKFK